jgi:hypothetical protein
MTLNEVGHPQVEAMLTPLIHGKAVFFFASNDASEHG